MKHPTCQRFWSVHWKVLGWGWWLHQWAMRRQDLARSISEGYTLLCPFLSLFHCSHEMNSSALPTCSLLWRSSPYAQSSRTKNTRLKPQAKINFFCFKSFLTRLCHTDSLTHTSTNTPWTTVPFHSSSRDGLTWQLYFLSLLNYLLKRGF